MGCVKGHLSCISELAFDINLRHLWDHSELIDGYISSIWLSTKCPRETRQNMVLLYFLAMVTIKGLICYSSVVVCNQFFFCLWSLWWRVRAGTHIGMLLISQLRGINTLPAFDQELIFLWPASSYFCITLDLYGKRISSDVSKTSFYKGL